MAEIVRDLKLLNLEITGYLYVNDRNVTEELEILDGFADDINDLSGNVNDLSGAVNDLSGRLGNLDLSGLDLSGEYATRAEFTDLSETVYDLSGRLDNLDLSGLDLSGEYATRAEFTDLSETYYGRQANNNSTIYGNNTGTSGGFNTYIGVYSGGEARGSSNVGLGYSSGYSISGDNNVAIGFRSLAVSDLSLANPRIDVSRSVLIGPYSGYGNSLLRSNDVFQLQNDSNAYLITGDFVNSNIAIGLDRLPSSSQTLEVGGDVSASNIFLGQNITGTNLFLSNNASISGNVTANEFLSESDRNLKKEIRKMEDGMEVINRLKPVYYKWKDEEKGVNEEVGFIAQEVEKVVPSLVQELRGIKHVAYSKIVSILTSAVKYQQSIIQEQKEKIRTQGRELTILSDKVKSIEQYLFSHACQM
jgi:uncharacterized protein YjbI with pentapeptide repeats